MLQHRARGRVGRTHADLLAAALALVWAACSHPGTGGSSPGGNGAGGSSAGGNGSGGAPARGGGAGGAPAGGNGGTGSGGGMSTATGGSASTTLPDGGGAPVTKMACTDDPTQQKALPYAEGNAISDAVKQAAMSAVQSMSLKAKADQLRGPNTSGYSDIFRTADVGSIKGFQFRDGPRGVNLDAVKAAGSQGYATVFPAAIARGAAFDVDLEHDIGRAMGDELIASGGTMLLAPTVNILRHPAWGRAQETYGEDSFHLGRLGSAYTVGVQEFAPACVKHYAANNVEKDRANAIAQMDEATLQDVYARHFGMIIQDGGAACVMAAYNRVQIGNGPATKCTQSKRLLTEILRDQYGFQGMVLSDWWAMPGGQSPGGADRSANATEAMNAGMDMELPWNLNYSVLENITGAEALITRSALRVLTTKFRFKVNATTGPVGLKAPSTSFASASYSITNNQAHIELAQKAALAGMVLLKNDKDTLPIPATVKTVAVVGPTVRWTLRGVNASGTINFATDAVIGDLGSSRVNADPAKTVGPFAGIKAAAPSGVNVVTASGPAAMAAAMGADFIVVVAGLTPQDEGEEYTITPEDADRGASLALDGKTGNKTQDAFIKAMAALGKPLVVVLEGGAPIDVSAWYGTVPALVMAWYPGQAGGTALGQLLFGKANFSGKLPVTWPASLADEPTFNSAPMPTAMSYYLGYRHFDTMNKKPLFAFGSGLSYAKYEYANLQVPCTTVAAKGVVRVSVDVRNTGAVDGDETVLVFVSYPGSKNPYRMPAAYKELKGFARVPVPAGGAKRVTIPIRVSDLAAWDGASKSMKVEPGTVKVMAGPSADKLIGDDTTTFTVQ